MARESLRGGYASCDRPVVGTVDELRCRRDDPSLAPYGLRMRDTADVAGRRAQRFIDVYPEVLT